MLDGPLPTLKEKLEALTRRRAQRSGWRAAYDSVLERLNSASFLPNVLPVGARFPDFVLPNAEGHLVRLGDLVRKGPVVATFFRGEWCPYCRMMLDSLVETMPAIAAEGATLIAITPETSGLPLETKQRHKATFEILSDVDCGVGLAAGVVFSVPDGYRRQLKAAEVELPERHGNEAWFLPIPATFVMDREGVVRWRFADADFTRRAEPADVIAALQQLSARLG